MSPLVTACDKSEQIDLFIYVTQSWQYQQYFLISFTYMYTKKPAFIYQFATPMLDFSKYAEFHTNLLQTHKNMKPQRVQYVPQGGQTQTEEVWNQ